MHHSVNKDDLLFILCYNCSLSILCVIIVNFSCVNLLCYLMYFAVCELPVFVSDGIASNERKPSIE